jgi:hypothetical protein
VHACCLALQADILAIAKRANPTRWGPLARPRSHLAVAGELERCVTGQPVRTDMAMPLTPLQREALAQVARDRAAAQTPERRTEIARIASNARWAAQRTECTDRALDRIEADVRKWPPRTDAQKARIRAIVEPYLDAPDPTLRESRQVSP